MRNRCSQGHGNISIAYGQGLDNQRLNRLMTDSKGWGVVPARTKRATGINTVQMRSKVPDLWAILDKLDIARAKGYMWRKLQIVVGESRTW